MWPKAVQEQFEEKIWFPVIFDSHRDFSKSLGMVEGESDAAGLSHTIYIIDEHQILRSIVYYDPHIPNTMEEVFRLVKFLQKTNACGIVTPDNWRPGDDWILTGPSQKKENGKEKPEMWYF
jgi:peroxiredoxin (alkyl hydroperoxide reductase subunit C)